MNTYKSQARPLFPIEVKYKFEQEGISVADCVFQQGDFPVFTVIKTPKALSEEARQALELIEVA